LKLNPIVNPAEHLPSLRRAYQAIEQAHDAVNAYQAARREPIAIIGMACRFPGQADSPSRFFENLLAGQDAISEVPATRWDKDRYWSEGGGQGKVITTHAGWLGAVDRFDAAFFGISPIEARSLDPQQRLLLETAWESLENAGIQPDSLYGQPVGVYVGISTFDYVQRFYNAGSYEKIEPYTGTGGLLAPAAGRIAYSLGLSGPAMCVDTACSSSQLAAHLACNALRNRECSAALVGGVNLILTPSVSINFSQANMLSPDGRCFTFDARANGYSRAEGCGMILLKRLSDAQRDGDRILACIRGSWANQDGASGGLTVPSGPSQQAVIRGALASAGLRPDEIDAIEAHGTGTALGDPIEVGAIDGVFESARRNRPLWVGSVKTQIGHMEAAAGMGSLLKSILALQHRVLPPHLHLENPNPRIPWDELQIEVPRKPVDWDNQSVPRRIGLSGFGFSGTNVHVILEEAPAQRRSVNGTQLPSEFIPPLLISAKSEAALQNSAGQWSRALRKGELTAHQAAHVLGCRRSLFSIRSYAVGNASESFAKDLESFTSRRLKRSGQANRVGFLFTGQGAQFAGMGKDAYDSLPVFRDSMDTCAEILKEALSHDLRALMFDAKHAAILDETAIAQPALFAFEYAFAQQWLAWGVEPTILIGHSLGEWVAATLAGIFSLEDALQLVALRGQLMGELPKLGSMLAVRAPAARAQRAAEPFPKLSLAADNAPNACTLSGPTVEIDAVERVLRKEGIQVKLLNVSHAFHSVLMEPILDRFESAVASVERNPPRIPIAANLDGLEHTVQLTDPEYWRRQIIAPVQFRKGVETAAQKADIFLELGPRPILTSFLDECLEENSDISVLPCSNLNKPLNGLLQSAIGELFVAGVALRSETLFPPQGSLPTFMPTYGFAGERHWTNCPFVDEGRETYDASDVPFPGRRLSLIGSKEKRFELVLSSEYPPSLKEHTLFDTVVVPGALHLALLLENASRLWPDHSLIFRDIEFPHALVLEESKTKVQLLVSPIENGAYTFSILSETNDGDSMEHARGILLPQPNAVTVHPMEVPIESTSEMNGNSFYEKFDHTAYGWGPAYRWVSQVSFDGKHFKANLQRPANLDDLATVAFHPGLLDSSFHPLTTALFDGDGMNTMEKGIFIPYRINKLTWNGIPPGNQPISISGMSRFETDQEIPKIIGSYLFEDSDKSCSLQLKDIEFRFIGRKTIERLLPRKIETVHFVGSGAHLPRLDSHQMGSVISLKECSLDTDLKMSDLVPDLLAQPLEEAQKAFRKDNLTALHWQMRTPASHPIAGAIEGLSRVMEKESGIPVRCLADDTENSLESKQWHWPNDFSSPPTVRLRSCLITGATSSLGRLIAEYWINNGCTELILVGRNQPDADMKALLEKLQGLTTDAEIHYEVVDLGDVSSVENLITQYQPRGIIHLAGRTADAAFANLTVSDLQQTFAAKVDGAWNLHKTTLKTELDYFVCFSSIASAIGTAGQSAYAAANGFLDGLCQYRKKQGLPAVSINWGLWSHSKMADNLRAEDRKRLEQSGLETLQTETALAHLRSILNHPQPNHMILSVQRDTFCSALPPSIQSALPKEFQAHESNVQKPSTFSNDPASQLASWILHSKEANADTHFAGKDPKELMQRFVIDHVRQTLGLSAESVLRNDEGLFSMGLDSLMAMDLRNRIQSALGIRLSATLLFDYPDIERLVHYLYTTFIDPTTDEDPDSFEKIPSQSDSISSDESAELSEEDLAALLEQELDS
jgi:acyl transferase domain-containing protein/acyl carrier protein